MLYFDDIYSMEIKTYTDLWSMEKKLYAIYDLQLPAPVSLRAVGIFMALGIPWMAAMAFLQVPLSPPLFLIYIIPPSVLAWLGAKPLFEGKNLFQYLSSRAKFLFQSRIYNNLAPSSDNSEKIYEVQLVVWQKEDTKLEPQIADI